LDSKYTTASWITPFMIVGDGTKQYKMEFKEVVKGDIEYVYLIMNGWDEPI